MLHVLGRKVLNTYISAFALIICIPLLSMLVKGDKNYTVDSFLSWMGISGMIAFPVILIYGSLISVGLEFLLPKWIKNRSVLIITQGIGHVAFGALHAILLKLDWFIYFTAWAALVYFLMDQLLICIQNNKHRLKVWIGLFLLPIVITVLVSALLPPAPPPLPVGPFTKEDAVSIATAGDGTMTRVYPDQVGKTTTEIDGYSVTRETKVSELGEETYEVFFVESWSKEEDRGEQWVSYIVSRGSLEHNGSGGKSPPFSID
ncbi:hypothetical protein I6N90_18405 [Paenibacillus sp. GSMTC-2017]|uniref:hypothetical protein n=1 Tax=Paenibacillus sp. GSMTC-2017 TaxID=2794350 RepID=UPI0018D5C366|nr:hypothetical protein [Paenibacillus sp. GSMTC-2017]MBH5319774.1 hypothetical protein [Paenibacillus sp. GSMTC-2017]